MSISLVQRKKKNIVPPFLYVRSIGKQNTECNINGIESQVVRSRFEKKKKRNRYTTVYYVLKHASYVAQAFLVDLNCLFLCSNKFSTQI